MLERNLKNKKPNLDEISSIKVTKNQFILKLIQIQ